MLHEIIYSPVDDDDLKLVEIDVHNYGAVLRLKVEEGQGDFVASNAVSIVQGHYHRTAWFRAVYLSGEPVGFVMLYDPRNATDESVQQNGHATEEAKLPDDGLFIWRLMIDRAHQGRGIGRRLIALLARLAKANGFARLYLSYVEAEGGPGAFYARCGFVETGRIVDGETEAKLDLG